MSTNNFCPNCGKPIQAGAVFCGECGFKVNGEQSTAEMQKDIRPVPQQQLELQQQQQQQQQFASQQQAFAAQTGTAEWSTFPQIYDKLPFSEETKKKYFIYRGRLNRWAYFCRAIVVAIVGGLSIAVLGGAAVGIGGGIGIFFGVLCVPLYVAIMVPAIMLQVRRWHDLNKTGWLVLTTFIPYVNIATGLYILFASGTMGPNQYGEDPLQGRH